MTFNVSFACNVSLFICFDICWINRYCLHLHRWYYNFIDLVVNLFCSTWWVFELRDFISKTFWARKTFEICFLEDGILMCVSSIVKWDYQNSFKPAYYFFHKKISRIQKALERKTSNNHPLRSLCAQKFVGFVV